MARAHDHGVHHVMPEAVSITQASEWGGTRLFADRGSRRSARPAGAMG
ncbi:MAG: hypothetical protein WDN04_14560 [Rhodospirillales bacterium]